MKINPHATTCQFAKWQTLLLMSQLSLALIGGHAVVVCVQWPQVILLVYPLQRKQGDLTTKTKYWTTTFQFSISWYKNYIVQKQSALDFAYYWCDMIVCSKVWCFCSLEGSSLLSKYIKTSGKNTNWCHVNTYFGSKIQTLYTENTKCKMIGLAALC